MTCGTLAVFCTGGGYSEDFINEIRTIHKNGRFFDGIVPDRYGAVDALCIAKKVLWLDDNISIYNTSKSDKHTWNSTASKGVEEINAFVKKSRADVDYTEKLLIPNVTASVNNIVASDYYNAAINGHPSESPESIINKIDIGYLVALVENDLLSESNIDGSVLRNQKTLLDKYISLMSDSDKIVLDETRKQIKEDKESIKIKTLFGLKPLIDKILRKGVLSNNGVLQSICIWLENKLSKDIVVIKDLADIR